VFERLGGNLYCLRLFAQDYANSIPIEVSIDTLEQRNRRQILDALRPEYYPERPGKGEISWTRGEWLAVLKLLAASKTGTVPYQTMIDTIFFTDRGLQSLINNDLIIYRPAYPVSAEPESHQPLIQVKSPVFLYSMRQVMKALPKPFITLQVINPSFKKVYREISIHPKNFSLAGLKWSIAKGWNRSPHEVESIIMEEANQEIYREEDLYKLKSQQKLEVHFHPLQRTKK